MVLATSCVSSQVGLPNPVLCPATCGRRECMHVLTGQKKLPHQQVCAACIAAQYGCAALCSGPGQDSSHQTGLSLPGSGQPRGRPVHPVGETVR